MQGKGVHHLGLATLDLDRTIDFYTGNLGWKVAWCDILEIPAVARIKHAFHSWTRAMGHWSPSCVQRRSRASLLSSETDINSAQHLPPAFYHFAFEADSLEDLEHRRAELAGKGVDVTPVVDASMVPLQIYFNDPNGLLLEYCFTVREFNEDDKVMKHREQPGPMVSDPEDAKESPRRENAWYATERSSLADTRLSI